MTCALVLHVDLGCVMFLLEAKDGVGVWSSNNFETRKTTQTLFFDNIFTIGILNLYFESAHFLLFHFQCSVLQYIVLPYITDFQKTADSQNASFFSYRIDEIADFIVADFFLLPYLSKEGLVHLSAIQRWGR